MKTIIVNKATQVITYVDSFGFLEIKSKASVNLDKCIQQMILVSNALTSSGKS